MKDYKIGLQTVSRHVEQVSLLRGLGVGAPFGATTKQTDRQDWFLWVQSHFGAKAEQTDSQTGLAAPLAPL